MIPAVPSYAVNFERLRSRLVDAGVKERRADELMKIARKKAPERQFEDTLFCWLKNQAGDWEVGARLPDNDAATAVLHVFPIDFHETPEMLARLKNDRPSPQPSVARSKVSRTQEVIAPVDSVAGRVAKVLSHALAILLLLTSTAAAAECRNIRCLDGDTLVADIDLGFDVVLSQQTIRIHNYDAWETSYRRQTIVFAKDELAKGALAKAALEKLLTGSKVTVEEVAGRDPYGRRLLDVYANGVNVGETLRAQGHERTEKRLSTLKND